MHVNLADRILNEPLDDFLYYVSFFLYTIGSFLSQTTFGSIGVPTNAFFWGAQIICAIFLLIRCIMQRYSMRTWLASILVLSLGLIAFYNSKESFLLWVLLFVVAGKDISIRKLAIISIWTIGTFTLLTTLCAIIGKIPSYYIEGSATRSLRSSLGFSHPNRLGQFLFEISMATAVLSLDRGKAAILATSILCLLVTFIVCDSRTACIGMLLLILSIPFFELFKRKPRFFSFLAIALISITIAASMFLMVSYDGSNPFMSQLNMLLSGRLTLMHQAYTTFGITAFGQPCIGGQIVGYSLATHSPYYFAVDNVYVHSLLKYGFIPTLCFIVLLYSVFIRSYRQREFSAPLLCLTIMAVIGFSEMYLMYIDCNYFVVLMAFSLHSAKAQHRITSPELIERSQRWNLSA